MTDTHALQTLRDKVAAGSDLTMLDFESAFPPKARIPTEASRAMDAYLGSLDAAKALHEAMLPDWKWYVDYSGEVGLWHKTGSKNGNIAVDECPFDNPARAWLLAILDALIGEAGE